MNRLFPVKKIWLPLAFLFTCCDVNAQQCGSFYLLQQNKTITFAAYNKKGNANGKIIYKISAQVVKGNSITATVQTNLLNKEGKSVNKGTSNVKCTAGMLMMDMNLFLPQQQTEQFNKPQAKVKNAFLEYPPGIKPGSTLKDGAFTMEIDNNGLKQTLKMQLFNRRATGEEKITTSAGSWDCIIIHYEVKLNIQTGPIAIPLNFEATEWYAPGFGIVKTESEAGATEIVAIQ